MTSTQNVFGENLLRIIKRKGIKQAELAEKIGVTQSCLSRWISGQRALHAPQRKKICSVLSISEDDFFHAEREVDKSGEDLGPLF